MHIVIAKVDEVLFEGEAKSLTVPGIAGEMTILDNHMPLVTTLKSGTATVRTVEEEKSFEVLGGLLEVRADGATVIL